MNNRRRGNGYELECVKKLKHLFPHIVTARSESRSRDNEGVDLMNNNERKNGFLPLDVQCKNFVTRVKYDDILARMPNTAIPVIFHKKTEKRGTKFFETGQYAILNLDDFIELVDLAYGKKNSSK